MKKTVTPKTPPNMGAIDRIARITIGACLLLRGAKCRNAFSKGFQIILGGMMLNTGLRGFDPVFDRLDVSTIPKAGNNILDRFKQAIPGQGVKPILTQQAIPKMPKREHDVIETVADALAIR